MIKKKKKSIPGLEEGFSHPHGRGSATPTESASLGLEPSLPGIEQR